MGLAPHVREDTFFVNCYRVQPQLCVGETSLHVIPFQLKTKLVDDGRKLRKITNILDLVVRVVFIKLDKMTAYDIYHSITGGLASFPFGFEGGLWDLIVLVPGHCLSFYSRILTFAVKQGKDS